MKDRLLKGLEEEVYTGTRDGQVVGLSARISAELPGFATEPDARNVEFTTAPYREYSTLIDRLMAKRCSLRRYLREIGDYTLIPGSTLSLAPPGEFVLSKEDNPYYLYIRDTYGTRVVTASTHINLGIDDPELLMRVLRVLRCEAPIFLGLTASSPFLHGEATGFDSTRWRIFPHTPERVPFFPGHRQFVAWFEQQLALGTMRNPRHLWVAARPNGPETPYRLDRLEIRICDRISEPAVIAGVVALAEARVWQCIENPELDPLGPGDVDAQSDRLIDLCTANEIAAAEASLDAEVVDWRSGDTLTVRRWAARLLDEVRPTARAHGFEERLARLETVLEEGNLAQRWRAQHAQGTSIASILRESMDELAELDVRYDPECPQVAP